MRQALVALVLTAALLAGCADSNADPDSADDANFEDAEAFQDIEVTETTGAIRGVVVNEAIVPLEGAFVQLTNGPNATTDKDGAFVFSGLEPGEYFLQASLAGYKATQQAATVVAGDKSPPVTKITLLADPTLDPYYQAYSFDGFIQCSGTFVVVAAAVCSIPNIFVPVTQDNFGIVYQMDAKPTWMQSELVWDSTQALGDKMGVMYSWGNCGGFLCDHEASGTSPVLLTANATEIDEINDGEYNGTGLFVRVFNRGLDEAQGRVGFTLNQAFTIYSHFFYGYQPPEGWRLSEDSMVPEPA